MRTIALYAGTFRPFTTGHLHIAEHAAGIFGRENVLIAFGLNPQKIVVPQGGMNVTMEGKALIDEGVKLRLENLGFDTTFYTCFLHELVESLEEQGDNVVVIRGLRNSSDMAYEDNQLQFMKHFKNDIKVVYLRCDKEFEHISSSAVRDLEAFRPGSAKKFIV